MSTALFGTRRLSAFSLFSAALIILLLAILIAGCSKDSPTDPTGPSSPAQPGNVTTTAGNGSITLNWDEAADATGYTVYWSTENTVDDEDATLTTLTNSAVHTGLINGTTYYYRISAVNDSGESSLSSQVSATPNGALAFRLIAGGERNSFAVDSNGNLYAWGDNSDGQLGIGSFSNQFLPVRVYGISDVVAVSASRTHTVAVTGSGQAFAWGANGNGQLGDGTQTLHWTPTLVSGPTNFIGVAAGRLHTVGVAADERVWAWGYNSGGLLGVGHDNEQNSPAEVSGIIGSAGKVEAGDNCSYFLSAPGNNVSRAFSSWGSNFQGQLGDATYEDRVSPVSIGSLADVTAFSAMFQHVVALKPDGAVVAWGRNLEGQLGQGHSNSSSSPVGVLALPPVIAVEAGFFHSLALTESGSVWSWGMVALATKGGDGNAVKSLPEIINNLSGVEIIAAGGRHNLVVKNDGSLWAWGDNLNGQLGDGTTMNRSEPVRVLGF